MSSSAVRLLLAANLRSHLGRFFAAIVAIAFATALLLAALIGRQVIRDQAPRAAQTLLGPAEVHLAATDTVHPFVDTSLIESLRDDPRVEPIESSGKEPPKQTPRPADSMPRRMPEFIEH